MSTSVSEAAFAYEEPSVATVLNQAGFLLVLNVVNVALDKLLYCGLIGQLFVGILWGSPGAKWISNDLEHVIQQLGYLGLIMLVYEGGLSMSIKALKANILLSIATALTGILTPIALSFVLKELASATSLQAFAAGAALSATSLGTTFTILSTTNLSSTRLGTVTTCAAMLDDVIGLVMVQVIANLGGSNASFDPTTVIRPVFVSIGFGVGVFIFCSFCLKPILKVLLRKGRKIPKYVRTSQFVFLAHTTILVGMVAGATYAGTSSLFAAYLSGVVVKYFDEIYAERKVENMVSRDNSSQPTMDQAHAGPQARDPSAEVNLSSTSAAISENHDGNYDIPTGEIIYEKYYKGPVGRILVPFFFASIGFAIPITQMFRGRVVWRGVVYGILMILGKMVTGLWLVRFSSSPSVIVTRISKQLCSYIRLACTRNPREVQKKRETLKSEKKTPRGQDAGNTADAGPGQFNNARLSNELTRSTDRHTNTEGTVSSLPIEPAPPSQSRVSLPPKPKSLYPPAILGLAMIARGEIGYLIASLAQSHGIFSNSGNEEASLDIYLVVIWAITICTLVGPIAVGTMTRRVKKLQQERVQSGGEDPLGVWGI